MHGEADLLPGLIVDRYADCLSVQTLIEATEGRRELFADLLQRLLAPRAIVERNDVRVRQHEGLEMIAGTLYGEALVALLNPDAQSMTTLLAQFQGRIPSPLPLNESIQQAWPQIVSLIAGTILLYVIGYIAFQRQEVRA